MRNRFFVLALLVVLVSSIAVFAQSAYRQSAPFHYPSSFVKFYPSMCIMVQPVKADPSCFVAGVVDCARYNKNICFTQCVNYVRNSCFDIESNTPSCNLEPNFYVVYSDKKTCSKAVNRLCSERCLSKDNPDFNFKVGFNARKKCILLGNMECSKIGRTLF
ncbi:hypothetical protein B6U93_01540 [Candidatus Woesearchaeota archaeon ex4484_78]|nr:MAG: hypothetical protein B6U93_01540 [Candidatus Woesearchaeota archaeon ex4484_78]